MKKLIVFGLVIAIAASMCISAFAVGGFMSSPSNNKAPVLVEGKNENEDCDSYLTITAYADRDKLTADERQEIEKAYSEIIGTQDLSSLNADIMMIAEDYGISVMCLSVSDLFDLGTTNCDHHDGHGTFTIKLQAETIDNFACLMYFHDNEWHIVEDVTITEDGEYIQFEMEQAAPYAIVVRTEEAPTDEPTPDEQSFPWALVAAAAVTATGLVVFFAVKNRKDEE